MVQDFRMGGKGDNGSHCLTHSQQKIIVTISDNNYDGF